jgi:UbiD family decarboxylase
LKGFLDALQAHHSLLTVSEEVSPLYDVSSILHGLQNRAVLFQKVRGSSLRVAGNLYGTKSSIALGLGVSEDKLLDALQEAVRNPSQAKGKISTFRKGDWDFNEMADLSKLPILQHFDREAGRYMTASIVAARFPGSDSENLSFHRMLVISKNKVAARIVPRHLSQIGKESSGKIPVSVMLGPPPEVFVSASLQVQYGSSEYLIANKLSKERLELCSSELSDIAVPLDSEIVLEGTLDFGELVDEGPFVDLTGTYDEVRKQPVITFERMHYRRDSVYHAVLASSSEHSIFMGLPQELKIIDTLLKSIPKVRGINLTPASGGYFHCVVSIDKSNDGDGKTAIMNCFAASHPLKVVVAVDSDVNPFDLEEVEWALATRFQASNGIVVINGARGSSLDPSSGKLAVTSKLGLDATLPVKQDREKFAKASISVSPLAKSVLESFRSSASTGKN